MPAPTNSANRGSVMCDREGYSKERTEEADNDPSHCHDSGPAGIEAIGKKAGRG